MLRGKKLSGRIADPSGRMDLQAGTYQMPTTASKCFADQSHHTAVGFSTCVCMDLKLFMGCVVVSTILLIPCSFDLLRDLHRRSSSRFQEMPRPVIPRSDPTTRQSESSKANNTDEMANLQMRCSIGMMTLRIGVRVARMEKERPEASNLLSRLQIP